MRSMETMGWTPEGKMVFRSQNLAGLIRYGRKHGISKVELGECITGRGLYCVTYGNGAYSKGDFESPRVMLGFFLNRSFVDKVECERVVFNQGASWQHIKIPFMCDIGREGSMRTGPWWVKAYRDENQMPMVRFTR